MAEYISTIFYSFVIGFFVGLSLIELRVLFRKLFVKKRHGYKSEDTGHLKADASILEGRQDYSSVDYK